MDLHVSLKGAGDLSTRIYRQLLEAVFDGRLRPGERLPPTRDLAHQLEVSRNTVTIAYERLVAEGFLTTRIGAGTFVSAESLSRLQRPSAPSGVALRARPVWTSVASQADQVVTPPPYDFRVGRPDARLFPLTTWRRLVARELRPAAVQSGAYGDAEGQAGLRAAIARHVGLSRAVRASADDVLVTSGGQQALDLIGRVLIEPGACVAVEEPGFPSARRLFLSLGARVAGVPVDTEGLDVAAIPKAARLVYVTPSHQFPLGTVMSLSRRAALLAWAERRGAVVIEDDYDSEFRFAGRSLEPIHTLDRSGRVVYVGTFSKVMLPMLRIGFLIAPTSLQAALRTAKQLTDRHSELPTQRALARFIDDGYLARHIRKARREYATRHQRVVEALQRECGDWLEVVPSVAGLHLAALVRPGVSVNIDAVVSRAMQAGVAVHALSRFCGESPSQTGLVIGYGAIPTAKIDSGISRLRASFST